MATHRVEAFSVSHAAILNGTTGAEETDGDIFGVRSASLAADIGNFDNTGDDAVLSSWFWFNFATVTVESGFIPTDMVALITGTPVVDYLDSDDYTAGTAATAGAETTAALAATTHVFDQELWTEQSINSAPRPMLIRMPSKDSAGHVRLLDFVLYRVQFSPINFTGPAYKAGLTVNYSGRAVMSEVNEKGTNLGTLSDGRQIKSVGRLINRPG